MMTWIFAGIALYLYLAGAALVAGVLEKPRPLELLLWPQLMLAAMVLWCLDWLGLDR